MDKLFKLKENGTDVREAIFNAIPGFATAPALIFVGFLMVTAVTDISFDDLTEAVPAYLCLLAMPLMYSISEGIAIGVISYVIINLFTKKSKKDHTADVCACCVVCREIYFPVREKRAVQNRRNDI